MKRVYIEATEITPYVDLDPDTGHLTLKGKSIPDNPLQFYMPMIEWADKYAKSPAKSTLLDVHLEYINSSSAKYLLEFMKRIEILKDKENANARVVWKYDEGDENMQEEGTDYDALIDLPFTFEEIAEE